MPFLDSNSHLTTKPSNFDIKCHINSESYDRHGFFATKFRGVPICYKAPFLKKSGKTAKK